ncbi:cytochrome P450 [Streptomyces sp. NRRL S-244]|uniref:cytochrome P450 n=1 Tax=Streptomyces sp. NRRL S-244 TaxID=1463897 RepID=UPI0004BFD22F|nr:cytochrome P450 [Streptomyces sp. NRRL S-244]
MRTLHEAALGVLPEDLTPAAGSQGGGAAMTGPGTTQSAVSRGQQARTGRAGAVRFAAGRALPLLVRGRSGGARPAFSADALRALRARHGGAPVLLRGLSGAVLVLLDRQELRQFYEAEPAAVLSPGPGGVRSCAAVRAVIAEEARHLTAAATLDLARTRHTVARAARRIVLGDGAAAGAEQLPGLLGRLRRRGRERAAGADGHTLLGQGMPGHGMLGHPAAYADREEQTLRAMDGIPATMLRTLLLLGTHPAEQDAAAAEAAGRGAPEELPRLRACVRECLRLYPAVPDLIRVTRTETEWRGVRHPAGTTVLLPAHFHQRDPEQVPAAHVFVPGRWKTPGADEDIRMAPFGHGPGRCPGDRLGLLITTALCAEVLRRRRITATRPVLDPHGPLPLALDPRGIRLTLTRR